MGKEHLELRSADALEHDEILKFRKKLIGDRVVTILLYPDSGYRFYSRDSGVPCSKTVGQKCSSDPKHAGFLVFIGGPSYGS